MLPLLKQLFAWGCWWEVNQGCPRSGAFVAPPIHSGRQHCRYYTPHHASPGCSTTAVAAVRHSVRDDAPQRCRWGVSSSSSGSSGSSLASSHSKKRTGLGGRSGLGGGESASSSFRRTGRRHRDYPGLFSAVTTEAVATSTLGTSSHSLEDGDLASSTGQGNRRLPSPRRQRQEKLRATPRRGGSSPRAPAAVAGMFASRLGLVHAHAPAGWTESCFCVSNYVRKYKDS